MKKMNGSTLFEVVIFITVLAVIGGSILLAFNTTLQNQPEVEKNFQAINLARERMELVLGNKNTSLGALTIDDLCSQTTPPDVCNVSTLLKQKYNPANYNVTTQFFDDRADVGSPVRGKRIVVTVTKPNETEPVAQLETVVTNY